MKNNIIILLIINIILLSINLLFNFPIGEYIFGIGVLLLLFVGVLYKKNVALYIIVSLPALFFITSTLINNFSIMYLVFVISFIIYYIYGFKYTFNLINNNMNIQFNSIKIPEDKEYLIIKYLLGPINGSNMNGIVIKEKDHFEILVEDKENNISKLDILFSDIESITANQKPYMKSSKTLSNYETDYMKSSAIGRYTGDFEEVKSFKVIPSYEIIILLKNNISIKLLSFNNPDIF